MDFEKKMARLEAIVQKMEKGDLQLEDSLKLFEEGVQISKDCHVQLSQAEEKVKIMTGVDESGRPVLKEFRVEDGD